MNPPLRLPKRSGGRKKAATLTRELAEDRELCDWLEERWQTHGFAFGARGWAYVVEGEAFITKGEFKPFEKWIARVRKDGLLHPDVISEDDARKTDNVEQVDPDDPAAFAQRVRCEVLAWLNLYTPTSFWDGLDTYVEVLVEKVDLKVLFLPVCERYGVPLSNGKGSVDVNLRRRMLQRFRYHYKAGRRVVLLYCGDHDPAGLRISDVLKQNLMDCANIRDVDWDPSPVEVIRFGLEAHQIEQIGLPWIDGLETGSGGDLGNPTHPDNRLEYVQTYLTAHGPRKVEANALAAHPAAAAAMVEEAINRYVPPGWPDQHAARLAPYREKARLVFEALIRVEGV